MRQTLRVASDHLLRLAAFAAGAVTIGLLVIGLALVLGRGLRSMSIQFLASPMREGGLSGGILYQLFGTGILLMTTLATVLPCALGVACVRSVYLRGPLLKKLLTTSLHVLNSIPSILFGVVGFWFFVKGLGWGKSWLAGSLLLAMMILPTAALTWSEGMDRVAQPYLDTARALGLRPAQVIWSVLVPHSLSSGLSGLLVGLARAAGETAPLMFTATVFSGASWPTGLANSPVLSLPYHIFNLAQDSYQPKALQNAWGTACVLLGVAIGLSMVALPFRLRVHEEAAHGA